MAGSLLLLLLELSMSQPLIKQPRTSLTTKQHQNHIIMLALPSELSPKEAANLVSMQLAPVLHNISHMATIRTLYSTVCYTYSTDSSLCTIYLCSHNDARGAS